VITITLLHACEQGDKDRKVSRSVNPQQRFRIQLYGSKIRNVARQDLATKQLTSTEQDSLLRRSLLLYVFGVRLFLCTVRSSLLLGDFKHSQTSAQDNYCVTGAVACIARSQVTRFLTSFFLFDGHIGGI